MFETVCMLLEDIFEQSDFTLQTTFEELYADFQDMQELLLMIEEEFDIRTSEEDIPMLISVSDLCEYITAQLEQQKK